MSDSEHPPHTIDQPGETGDMAEQPRDEMRGYVGSGKLEGRVALITGGDSGIGRAVAVAFAKEGADVAIAYLEEHDDARRTVELAEAAGRRAIAIAGDLSEEEGCRRAVREPVAQLGALHVLVNHVGTQTVAESLEEISTEQWDGTFKTNVYSYFWTTK